MFLYSGSYWLFMIPAFILVMLAQWWVNSTYRKWSRVPNGRRLSGAEAAQRLLRYGQLYDVQLEGTPGQLSDHYDPRSRTLRLSPGVAQQPSVASVAIAAHEIGHALQHQSGYLPLRFRAALVPAANLGSTLGWIFILVGLFMRGAFGTQLAWLGVAFFGLGTLFALATVPVELNASARARRLLQEAGLISDDQERKGVNAVLRAAAFTYIAALAASLMQLLYYASLVAGLGGLRRS